MAKTGIFINCMDARRHPGNAKCQFLPRQRDLKILGKALGLGPPGQFFFRYTYLCS